MALLLRCLDIETTGLDPTIHRIVEVATVDVIVTTPGDGGGKPLQCERGRMWSSLVNPGIPIPPEASAVHDITDEMVKDAPKLFDVMDRIVTDPDPDYYCAHNSRFDMKFLDQTVLRRPWLDTYRIALWLWPSAPEHKLATLRYWLKLKLDSSATVFNAVLMQYGREYLELRRGHIAILDAHVCAAVLRRAFTTGATIKQMIEISSQPALLPRLTFGKWAMKPIETIEIGYLDWILGQRDMDEDVRHTAFTEIQRRRNLDKLEASR